MPDVKIWMDKSIIERTNFFKLDQVIGETVAENMSCEVDGEFYRLNHNTEVDTTAVGEITGIASANVIVEVAAYDFPDRMVNITERIEAIAKRLRDELGLNELEHISITFIPVRQGCWVKV